MYKLIKYTCFFKILHQHNESIIERIYSLFTKCDNYKLFGLSHVSRPLSHHNATVGHPWNLLSGPIPLNVWASQALCTTARPIATQFLGHGRMDNPTERSFDSQAIWVFNVLGLFLLTCYPWVIVQPGTGRRPVEWRRINHVDSLSVWSACRPTRLVCSRTYTFVITAHFQPRLIQKNICDNIIPEIFH